MGAAPARARAGQSRARPARTRTTASAQRRRPAPPAGAGRRLAERMGSADHHGARLRTLLEEVIVTVFKAQHRARLTLRWRGGSLTDIDVDLPRQKPAIVRTDEDTIALVRRLAAHYPDAVIAGILNRQDRQTAYGHRFTANHVGNLQRHWKIARFELPATPPESELLTIAQTAAALGVA